MCIDLVFICSGGKLGWSLEALQTPDVAIVLDTTWTLSAMQRFLASADAAGLSVPKTEDALKRIILDTAAASLKLNCESRGKREGGKGRNRQEDTGAKRGQRHVQPRNMGKGR